VPDSGRLLIVAPTNSGKTWVALLAAFAAGKAGRSVYFVEEEGSARALADRMKALGIVELERFHVAHLKGLLLDDSGHREELRCALAADTAPVMVLDPLVSLWRGDENSTKDANIMRGHLEELAKANPSSLLIVLHHTGKGTPRGDGPDPFAGRGSSVFPGWADVQLNLAPVNNARGSGVFEVDVSVAKDREGERGIKRRLRIVLGTGTVSFEDVARGGDEDLAREIVRVLRKAPDGLTKTAIARAIPRQKQAVLQAVSALVDEGRVEATANGFRLVKEGEQ
jgi:hypothetical protein